jgi:chaperonin GroES
MKLQPLADRIVARQAEPETKTAGGFLLPDQAKEKVRMAEVVAVGPGRLDDNGQRVPLEVKVGDQVIYNEYGPSRFKQGSEELLIIKEDDILAVVKE